MKKFALALLAFYPVSALAVVSDEFECQITKIPKVSASDKAKPVLVTKWKTAANRRESLTFPSKFDAGFSYSSSNPISGESLALNLNYQFVEVSDTGALLQSTCFTANACEPNSSGPCTSLACLLPFPDSPKPTGTVVDRDASGNPIFDPNARLSSVISRKDFFLQIFM